MRQLPDPMTHQDKMELWEHLVNKRDKQTEDSVQPENEEEDELK